MGAVRVYHPGLYQLGEVIQLTEAAAHHLIVVLRKKKGDSLILVSGDNQEWSAELVEVSKKALYVKLVSNTFISRESPLSIHLAQALCKGDKFDWIIQKAVELGVKDITPIISTKSAMTKLSQPRVEHKYQHWQAIMISAIEQCGRNILPALHPICELDTFLKKAMSGHRWILDPHAPSNVNPPPDSTQPVTILIGPEGGWSDSERARATQSGFLPISLGPRILRTETAPIAMLAILQAWGGDLSITDRR